MHFWLVAPRPIARCAGVWRAERVFWRSCTKRRWKPAELPTANSRSASQETNTPICQMSIIYHCTSEVVFELWSKILIFWSVTQRSRPLIGVWVMNVMRIVSCTLTSWSRLTISDFGVTGPITVKWHSCSDKWIITWESNFGLILEPLKCIFSKGNHHNFIFEPKNIS